MLKKQLGLANGIDTIFEGMTIRDSIMAGGKREDASTRFLHHFHDPLRIWPSAGLASATLGISSLMWAQLTADPLATPSNEYSWVGAKNNYYKALTTGDKKAWGETFRSLGQLMHLISDLGVPAHVRDDSHPFVEPYDIKYVADPTKISQYVAGYSGGVFPKPDQGIFNKAVWNSFAPAPISALWDQDVYTSGGEPPQGFAGLAEYTNAYFFSEDTMSLYGLSMAKYPHPSVALDTNYADIDWNDPDKVAEKVTIGGKEKKRIYLRNKKATPSHRLLGASYLFMDASMFYTAGYDYTWFLDDIVYEDYAKALVPRAVGYSAALLDYFFRGKISVKSALTVTDSAGNIIGIDLWVKNVSKLDMTPELMQGGTFSLAYKYTPPIAGADPVYGLLEDFCTVADAGAVNDEFVHLEPRSLIIPYGSTDISITLVYRGKLGGEDDAVVGRVIPLTSRIAYTGQIGCGTNDSHIYTIGRDGTDNVKVTDDSDGYKWRALPSWSADGKMLVFNGITSDNHYDIVVVDLTSEPTRLHRKSP